MDMNVLNSISYGLYTVTAYDNENSRHTGCIANAVFQVTAVPPIFAVCINRENHTRGCIMESGKFAVSIISEETPQQVIAALGFSSGRSRDKLARIPFSEKDGLAVVDDTCGYLLCRVTDSFESPTHTIILGEAVEGEITSQAPPMTYEYYHRVRKGRSTKAAPTYIPQEGESKPQSTDSYVCEVCGYIHAGKPEEGYTCPVCSAPDYRFSKK